MSKLASGPQAVKSNFRISYPFTPVPASMLERLDHPTAERLYKALCDCLRRGWNDPPVRYLAGQIRRSYMQTMRGMKILERAGYVRRIRRRISRTRCATNLYELCVPNEHKCYREALSRDLNTKASRAARPHSIPAMIKRLRWYEHHAASLQTRVNYYERGRQIEQARQWRSQKEAHAAHMEMLAQVGVAQDPGRIPEDEIERLRRMLEEREKASKPGGAQP